MDLNGIRAALRKVPFTPFSICLADGRKLPVRYPEFVAVGTRRMVVIDEDDSWSIIEPLLVVSLDSVSPEKGTRRGKRGTNGG